MQSRLHDISDVQNVIMYVLIMILMQKCKLHITQSSSRHKCNADQWTVDNLILGFWTCW